MKRLFFIITAFCLLSGTATLRAAEPLQYGNFESWTTRNFKESRLIGGKSRKVYEVGPQASYTDDKGYRPEASQWATSNVVAKVAGITKCSNAVFPDTRADGGRCAKLTTLIEHCSALGIIDIDVLVAGTMFLGRMFEPIKSTSQPYSKMEMGVPFTRRPEAVEFDYRVEVPQVAGRIYSSGFGKKKTMKGTDRAEVMVLLQRRWEDADGNLYAKRVGTGRERFGTTTAGWVNKHHMPITYGNATGKDLPDLIAPDRSYYARNSKGKMVPVREVGWDEPDATPTHIILMFSAGSGAPYVGTPGLTLWVDNVGMVY